MFEKILVAVDGSEASKKAVELTATLAGTSKAEVLVFHVREVEIGRHSGALELPADARHLVNEQVDALIAKGVLAKGEIKEPRSDAQRR